MNETSFSLDATLSLLRGHIEFLNQKKVKLLEHIMVYGSIAKAAKASEITYKTAWNWIDKMNSIAPKPLVQKISGGKDGGGTIVTAYAKELMHIYEEVHALQFKHLQSLSESFGSLENGDNSPFFTFSELVTQVKAIEIKADKAHVVLTLKNNQLIYAMSPASFIQVNQLKQGESLTALIESDMITISKKVDEKISSRNQLCLRVSDIVIKEDEVLLSMCVSENEYLKAVITKESFDKMKITLNDEVIALFKAYSVTLFK